MMDRRSSSTSIKLHYKRSFSPNSHKENESQISGCNESSSDNRATRTEWGKVHEEGLTFEPRVVIERCDTVDNLRAMSYGQKIEKQQQRKMLKRSACKKENCTGQYVAVEKQENIVSVEMNTRNKNKKWKDMSDEDVSEKRFKTNLQKPEGCPLTGEMGSESRASLNNFSLNSLTSNNRVSNWPEENVFQVAEKNEIPAVVERSLECVIDYNEKINTNRKVNCVNRNRRKAAQKNLEDMSISPESSKGKYKDCTGSISSNRKKHDDTSCCSLEQFLLKAKNELASNPHVVDYIASVSSTMGVTDIKSQNSKCFSLCARKLDGVGGNASPVLGLESNSEGNRVVDSNTDKGTSSDESEVSFSSLTNSISSLASNSSKKRRVGLLYSPAGDFRYKSANLKSRSQNDCTSSIETHSVQSVVNHNASSAIHKPPSTLNRTAERDSSCEKTVATRTIRKISVDTYSERHTLPFGQVSVTNSNSPKFRKNRLSVKNQQTMNGKSPFTSAWASCDTSFDSQNEGHETDRDMFLSSQKISISKSVSQAGKTSDNEVCVKTSRHNALEDSRLSSETKRGRTSTTNTQNVCADSTTVACNKNAEHFESGNSVQISANVLKASKIKNASQSTLTREAEVSSCNNIKKNESLRPSSCLNTSLGDMNINNMPHARPVTPCLSASHCDKRFHKTISPVTELHSAKEPQPGRLKHSTKSPSKNTAFKTVRSTESPERHMSVRKISPRELPKELQASRSEPVESNSEIVLHPSGRLSQKLIPMDTETDNISQNTSQLTRTPSVTDNVPSKPSLLPAPTSFLPSANLRIVVDSSKKSVVANGISSLSKHSSPTTKMYSAVPQSTSTPREGNATTHQIDTQSQVRFPSVNFSEPSSSSPENPSPHSTGKNLTRSKGLDASTDELDYEPDDDYISLFAETCADDSLDWERGSKGTSHTSAATAFSEESDKNRNEIDENEDCRSAGIRTPSSSKEEVEDNTNETSGLEDRDIQDHVYDMDDISIIQPLENILNVVKEGFVVDSDSKSFTDRDINSVAWNDCFQNLYVDSHIEDRNIEQEHHSTSFGEPPDKDCALTDNSNELETNNGENSHISNFFKPYCYEYLREEVCSKVKCVFLHEVPDIQIMDDHVRETMLFSKQCNFTHFIDSAFDMLISAVYNQPDYGNWETLFQLADVSGIPDIQAVEKILGHVASSTYMCSASISELLMLLLEKNLLGISLDIFKMFPKLEYDSFPSELLKMLIDEVSNKTYDSVFCRELYDDVISHVSPSKFKYIDPEILEEFSMKLVHYGLKQQAESFRSKLSIPAACDSLVQKSQECDTDEVTNTGQNIKSQTSDKNICQNNAQQKGEPMTEQQNCKDLSLQSKLKQKPYSYKHILLNNSIQMSIKDVQAQNTIESNVFNNQGAVMSDEKRETAQDAAHSINHNRRHERNVGFNNSQGTKESLQIKGKGKIHETQFQQPSLQRQNLPKMFGATDLRHRLNEKRKRHSQDRISSTQNRSDNLGDIHNSSGIPSEKIDITVCKESGSGRKVDPHVRRNDSALDFGLRNNRMAVRTDSVGHVQERGTPGFNLYELKNRNTRCAPVSNMYEQQDILNDPHFSHSQKQFQCQVPSLFPYPMYTPPSQKQYIPYKQKLKWNAASDGTFLRRALDNRNWNAVGRVLEKLSGRIEMSDIGRQVYEVLKLDLQRSGTAFTQLVCETVEGNLGPSPFFKDALSTIGMNLMLDLILRRDWKGAHDMYSIMRNKGINILHSEIFKEEEFSPCRKMLSCVQVCTQVNSMEEAVDILKSSNLLSLDVKQWGVTNSEGDAKMWLLICVTLLHKITSEGPILLAHNFFLSLLKAQGSLSEGVELQKYCNTLMVKLLDENYWQEALELYSHIKAHFRALESPTYRALLAVLVSENKIHMANSIYQAARCMNIYSCPGVEKRPFHVIIYSYLVEEEIYVILYDFLQQLAKESRDLYDNPNPDNYKTIIWIEELKYPAWNSELVPKLLTRVDTSKNGIQRRIYSVLRYSFSQLATCEKVGYSNYIWLEPRSVINYLQFILYPLPSSSSRIQAQ